MADGDIRFQWGTRRRLPMIMQSESTECALACLVMIARFYGHDVDLASMRRRHSTSLKGVTLLRLLEIAQTIGLGARPIRCELDYFADAKLPCILHWDLNHFVVLERITKKGAEILDPARGRRCIPLSEVSKHFTGIAVEITHDKHFQRVKSRERISLRTLAGRIEGLRGTLTQVFGLAAALELIALAMPFQIQWVVDQVLPSSDINLLIVIMGGFLIMTAIQAGFSITRAWIISWLGATLNVQWTTGLFGHLLKLPLEYFEKRHIGDVVSRFSSMQSIQSTLTGSFIEAVLDGLTSTLALVILYIYSPALTACVAVAVLIYVSLRCYMYPVLWSINEEQLTFGARQQTELMESIRGIQAIKLGGQQSQRAIRLANATQEYAFRYMKNQRITLGFSAINQGIFTVQRILLIGIGGYLAIESRFTAGMLVAFVAYADQFSSKAGGLVDKFVDFKMLSLHAERIADIALCEPEPHMEGAYVGTDLAPKIEARGLGFRYAENEPWIFRNLDLLVHAGESVAIVGPSGCGKSTLAKLLLGLLEPNEGVIEIDGINIQHYGLNNYRKMFGAVMQNDSLFVGSIADNISFFDVDASEERVIASACLAGIHDEVSAMPMGYESPVGDMGSALSGGQKQRIVLARALYRQPKILLLDEATSHLDIAGERRVNDSVNQLGMTKIIIAHRPESIRSADRVINLNSS